jgi:hypothetical protein
MRWQEVALRSFSKLRHVACNASVCTEQMHHLKERASIVIIRPASRSDAVENVREDQALEEDDEGTLPRTSR